MDFVSCTAELPASLFVFFAILASFVVAIAFANEKWLKSDKLGLVVLGINRISTICSFVFAGKLGVEILYTFSS